MSARVYVAAPFSEWKLVREVQAEIRRRSATITFDWTKDIESLPPGMTDGDVSEEVALDKALSEIQGIIDADAFLSLTVSDKSKGCGQWTELGAGIVARLIIEPSPSQTIRNTLTNPASLPRIALCGPMRDRTIFSRLGKRFADWKDALPYVLGETSS